MQISGFRKESRKEHIQGFGGKTQGYSTFGRVRSKQTDRSQIVENSPCSALRQTRYARDFTALEFTPDQSFFQQTRGFRPELIAALDVAAQSQRQSIELEEALHEVHLIQCDLEKPLDEVDEGALGEIAAAVKVALPGSIRAIHHAFVLAATFEASRKAS